MPAGRLVVGSWQGRNKVLTCEGGGGGGRKEGRKRIVNKLTDIIDTGFIRHVFSNAIPDLNFDKISQDTS